MRRGVINRPVHIDPTNDLQFDVYQDPETVNLLVVANARRLRTCACVSACVYGPSPACCRWFRRGDDPARSRACLHGMALGVCWLWAGYALVTCRPL